MKRAPIFDCGHVGAERLYVSTFSSIARVVLCHTCAVAINENPQDPRAVGATISEAVELRDIKHPPKE